jgi:hypothetical protein
MTMTLPSDKLGDFFSAQLSPKVPTPIINGIPGQMVTLANQDLTQNVTISRSNTVTGGAIIPPLGSITVDMSKTIWGTAPAGTLPLLVFPGGGQWAPSPAQVAAQINALGLATLAQQITQQTVIPNNISTTGAPTVNNNLVVLNSIAQTIATGVTKAYGTFSVTRPTFEVIVSVFSAVADTQPFIELDLAWMDSVSGANVDNDKYYLCSNNSGATVYSYHGIGVSHGDQVSASIKNWGSATATVSLLILQNGKPNPISNELWKMLNPTTISTPGGGFVNFGGNDPAANTLLNSNFTIATGVTSSRLMTTYYGRQINLSVHTGSGLSDLQVKISYAAPVPTVLGLNSSIIEQLQSNGSGNVFSQIQLPNYPVQIDLTNQNASTRTIDIVATGA